MENIDTGSVGPEAVPAEPIIEAQFEPVAGTEAPAPEVASEVKIDIPQMKAEQATRDSERISQLEYDLNIGNHTGNLHTLWGSARAEAPKNKKEDVLDLTNEDLGAELIDPAQEVHEEVTTTTTKRSWIGRMFGSKK